MWSKWGAVSSGCFRLAKPLGHVANMTWKRTVVFTVSIIFMACVLLYTNTCKIVEVDNAIAKKRLQGSSEFVNRKLSEPEHSAAVVLPYQPTNQSNQPSGILPSYASRIFSYGSQALENENFTLLMMTYKRVNLVSDLLKHYCKLPHLDRVVIVWNDVDSPVPDDLKKTVCLVPIHYIVSKQNKLTNRFKPRPEIRTDCEFCTIFNISLASCFSKLCFK